jgi:membrane protease YdiL (CAAX protease family)
MPATCVIPFFYSAVALLITAVWVRVLHNKSFAYLSYAMFFPSAVAVASSLLFSDDLLQFLSSAFAIRGINHLFAVTQNMVYGALLDACVIGGCAGLAVALQWGQYVQTSGGGAVHAHNRNMLSGFLRAAGEELGWRSYLLPKLMACYSPSVALLISGIVWALFHTPVMILLVRKLGVKNSGLTVLVQNVSCCLAAFSFGFIAIRSEYSVWPSAFMHFFWNRLNPLVLGSIYTNEDGMISGEQWKINGEGFLGCIVYIPVVCFVLLCI